MHKKINKAVETKDIALANQLRKQVSFRALLKADGHKFHGRGRKERCFCPFHAEGTPTFSVNRNDTDGGCMECEWFGNVIGYVMKFHHVDFTTALARLEKFVSNHPRAKRKEVTSDTRSAKLKYRILTETLMQSKLGLATTITVSYDLDTGDQLFSFGPPVDLGPAFEAFLRD